MWVCSPVILSTLPVVESQNLCVYSEVRIRSGFESTSRFGGSTGPKLEAGIGIGIRFWFGLSFRVAVSSWRRA